MKSFVQFLLLALLFQGLLAGCARKAPLTPTSPQYVDAVELKLKIRELADQLLSTMPNSGLNDLVAMPTSFVDLENKRATSPLGNLFAESLIYEFNQRGFPVFEYHITGNVDTVLGQGDFALLRQGVTSTAGKKWAALLVGTYQRDKDVVFINARLVRARDGMVLRTAQLVLLKSAVVDRLSGPISPTADGAPAKGKEPLISGGAMRIVPAPWKASAPQPKSGLRSAPTQQ